MKGIITSDETWVRRVNKSTIVPVTLGKRPETNKRKTNQTNKRKAR